MRSATRPLSAGVGGLVRVLIQALVPLVLVLTNVRFLLTPAFVRAEYSTPGFPDDPYGFDLADRLRWSRPALEFLSSGAGPEALGVLRFADGSPVFNARELSHMVDVQRLVERALAVWLGSSAALGLAIVVAWRLGGWSEVRSQLRRGAWTTLALMAGLLVVLALSFTLLFVGFHQLFFESGTWVFYHSDTLIRLFPQRFWRDAFAVLLLLTLAEAAILLALTRRRARSAD